uniref:Uncharacterized protein n=1 Tax=Solanum tuberosum TaxID=4113 RepID=M1D9E3_SOLTU
MGAFVTMDRSTSLVRITDQLNDSPFGIIHRHLVPAYSIVVLWVIGQHGTVSGNCSAMRRLFPYSADLILFFKAQHTGTKGELTACQTLYFHIEDATFNENEFSDLLPVYWDLCLKV